MNEAGRAFVLVRTEASLVLREQERYLRREAETQRGDAVRAAELKVKDEANAAFQRHQAESQQEVLRVEMLSQGQTEMVIQEAERAYQSVRLEAQGSISETSSEAQRLAFFVRTQESQLQSQSYEINQNRTWMERSLAEARARDTQLEENLEKKTEAVEAERRSARALSEERRRIHSEGVERRFEG